MICIYKSTYKIQSLSIPIQKNIKRRLLEAYPYIIKGDQKR